jgi:hypothetical protein
MVMLLMVMVMGWLDSRDSSIAVSWSRPAGFSATSTWHRLRQMALSRACREQEERERVGGRRRAQ